MCFNIFSVFVLSVLTAFKVVSVFAFSVFNAFDVFSCIYILTVCHCT